MATKISYDKVDLEKQDNFENSCGHFILRLTYFLTQENVEI